MVSVNSTMLALGTTAPHFALPDPAGEVHDLDDVAAGAPALVVMFLSNHCPYVQHLSRELGLITQQLAARGTAIVGVMSNDVGGYPDDAPDRMAVHARTHGWDFPYLYDESQAVAIAYRAACTPDLYVFDGGRRLVYRGQFDGSRPKNDVAVTGVDLRAAVTAVLDGAAPTTDQYPSMGCNIKWKPGNAPDYFG